MNGPAMRGVSVVFKVGFVCWAAAFAAPAGAQLVTIDTVLVEDVGNPAASAGNAPSWGSGYGYGSVPTIYRIGVTEVTISQYTTFLNAVAVVNPASYLIDLWNSQMANFANIAGIARTGSGTVGDPYQYAAIGNAARPTTYVSWFDAARFANWMHNGATAGADTEAGAYNLGGAVSGVFTRQPGARWWIPSEDEWVKAAYYGPALNGGTGGYTLYANQSNVLTTNTIGAAGGANFFDGDYATTQSATYSNAVNYLTAAGAYATTTSAYGTFDQTGNVLEWNDAIVGGSNRGFRGGSWIGNSSSAAASERFNVAPTSQFANLGFRMAAIPEPSIPILISFGALLLLPKRRSR